MTISRIFILIITVFSLTSCFTDRIDLDLNEDNKTFVITGWITNLGEPQFISLSHTVNYLGAIGIDPVSNAYVSLHDEIDSYTLIENEPGKYFLPNDWAAKVGNNYTLTVIHDGVTYTATHTMRSCPEIQDLTYRQWIDDDPVDDEEIDSIYIYETIFSFQEIPGEGDAYYGIDYRIGSLSGDSLVNGSFTDDEFIDGEYLEEIGLSDDERLFKLGDTVVVELFSIGRETARFLTDIESEIYRGGPFDAPPANIRSNISGGEVFGYFIISDTKRAELIIN